MYKDINIVRVGQFKQFINKAFISDKGIVTVVTMKRKIGIFHEDNPTHVIHLDRQLEQNFFFKFKKVKQIREINNEDKTELQTTLFFLLDSSICLVSLNITKTNEESQPKICLQRIKLVNIFDDAQIPQNNNNFIDLIDIRGQTALFTFQNIGSQQIKVLSYQITASNHSTKLLLLFNSSLTYDEDLDQTFFTESLLFNRFKAKWFDHYLIFFDQNISNQNVNRIYMADLTTCVEGNKFRIQNVYELPERIDYGFLKDIYIMPLNRQISQLPVSLFFQYPKYLQIIDITLKDSKTALKTIRHPLITLLSIVNSSITPHQLQIKGQNHSRETLTYLIHFVNGLDQTNKLAIIGSPTSYKPINIANEIELPKNMNHFVSNSKNNYIVCRDQILKIILTPKSQLYRQMLTEINAEVLRQMVEQFLE